MIALVIVLVVLLGCVGYYAQRRIEKAKKRESYLELVIGRFIGDVRALLSETPPADNPALLAFRERLADTFTKRVPQRPE